jgi:hypothetical protein
MQPPTFLLPGLLFRLLPRLLTGNLDIDIYHP